MNRAEKPVRRRRPLMLPAAERSECVLARTAPDQVHLFRFLLEGYENLALFTVLNRKTGLLKVVFSPHQRAEARAALEALAAVVPLRIAPWPAARQTPETTEAQACFPQAQAGSGNGSR